LVHPELVLLAAHCVGLEPSTAIFGDDYTSPQISAVVKSCTPHPRFGELGYDIGHCRLAEPIPDLPLVPLLAGCEASVVVPGAEVTAVGFGLADDALGAGPKRQVSMPIVSVGERDALIGGQGKDTCTGDSGGPAFIRLGDGTWRLLGVTSHGETCGEGGHYSLVPPAVAWLEQSSGLDLTPCHEGGDWAPSAACGGMPLEPGLGGGVWSEGCATDAVSEWSTSCGAAYDPATAGEDGDELRARGGCAISAERAEPGTLGLLALLVAGWLASRRMLGP
jgi:hypothetical protein